MDQLSQILRNALLSSGLNQTKAAQLIGIERKTLNSYIQGRTEPDLETLGKIARALKIGPDIYRYLMEQDVPPSPQKDKKVSLEMIADDLQKILHQQVYTRAEIRAFGEYQVMKDSRGSEQTRAEIMATINKLVGVQLGGDVREDRFADGRS